MRQEARIASSKETGNPRYLITLLEDIVAWGKFETLDERIAVDLKAQNTAELYELLLARVEQDYGADGKKVRKNSHPLTGTLRSRWSKCCACFCHYCMGIAQRFIGRH